MQVPMDVNLGLPMNVTIMVTAMGVGIGVVRRVVCGMGVHGCACGVGGRGGVRGLGCWYGCETWRVPGVSLPLATPKDRQQLST